MINIRGEINEKETNKKTKKKQQKRSMKLKPGSLKIQTELINI